MNQSEMRVLRFLAEVDHGDRQGVRSSSIGYHLWEFADVETRKRNPSPQGLALLAGRFIHTLYKKKLIMSGRGGYGYLITQIGRKALEGT